MIHGQIICPTQVGISAKQKNNSYAQYRSPLLPTAMGWLGIQYPGAGTQGNVGGRGFTIEGPAAVFGGGCLCSYAGGIWGYPGGGWVVDVVAES